MGMLACYMEADRELIERLKTESGEEIFEEIPDEHYREFPLDMKRYYCKTRSYIWSKSCWDYEWEEGQLSDVEEANPEQ